MTPPDLLALAIAALVHRGKPLTLTRDEIETAHREYEIEVDIKDGTSTYRAVAKAGSNLDVFPASLVPTMRIPAGATCLKELIDWEARYVAMFGTPAEIVCTRDALRALSQLYSKFKCDDAVHEDRIGRVPVRQFATDSECLEYCVTAADVIFLRQHYQGSIRDNDE